MKLFTGMLIIGAGLLSAVTQAAEPTLSIEARIPLGDIKGRIDHLALDIGRKRLYVAELGDDSVGVVDLSQLRVLRTITGLKEPQGIAYVPSVDRVYVANAGDGSVRLFNAADLSTQPSTITSISARKPPAVAVVSAAVAAVAIDLHGPNST